MTGAWLAPKFDNIPTLLRQHNRWLIWTKDGNGRKVPRAVHSPDKNTDGIKPTAWCSFEALLSAKQPLSGPGFALGSVDGGPTFAGIDLDHCRDPQTGAIDAWAQAILNDINSYAEVSPSGTGVKIFLTGTLPEDSVQGKVYGLEIYDRKRYFTVTGHHVKGTPLTVESREIAFRQLHARQRSGNVLTLLGLFGFVLRERGDWIDVRCPWSADHSQEDHIRDCAIHLKDGQVTGFECFHSSHKEKNLADVMKLFGLKIGHSSKFVLGKDDRPIANSQENIRRALALLGVGLSHDVFSQKMIFARHNKKHVIEDDILDSLWLEVESTYHFLPTKDFFYTVVQNEARHRPFHPVRDYLNALEWDGVERIDRWLPTYGQALDTDYTRAVGRLTLVAAVKRARQPGCKFDELLVLESAQGLNKSSALRALCPRSEWFSDDLPLNVDAKQVIERTAGKWIIEAAELSGTRSAHAEHLKALLSRQVDGPCRMAYARIPVSRPRSFIVMGTTNAYDYLKDPSGGRRFWPVTCGQFDANQIRRDRDQLWAEAAHAEAAGDSIRLDPKLWERAKIEQDQRHEEDPWEETIMDSILTAPDYVKSNGRQSVAVNTIWDVLNIPVEHRNPASHARVRNIMIRLGFKKSTVRIGTGHDSSVSKAWIRDLRQQEITYESNDDSEESE